ncbi:hypothetical protein M1L60_13470 [Actinoplanes sp. TRM 88003]|uniref:Tetratricopeptide repeat protein n=1 Tax=Paractinoplanes aksuensis TaxID=2939490 RepID=A0ABT1DL85_9ACTN|nr:SAV_2336 N-terminal domain-related protein [Actinoplanes aksuensis]MCO8271602.1 hypothetical protein [Actinoplanes aksuensis]
MNLEDLREALCRGGVDPTPRELAETLWLAAQITPAASPRPPAPTSDESRRPEPIPAPQARSPIPEPPPVRPPEEPREKQPLHIYRPPAASPAGGREARMEDVPKATALDGRLAFQRALRPLLRRVPSFGLGSLDEEATARLAADHPVGSAWPVVMRPPSRLWLDAAVVVDHTDSMAIWQDLAAGIVSALRESGVFRQVAEHRLSEDGLTDWRGRPLPSGRLVDPSNRRIVLVISDCVGPVWRSGLAGQMLHEWGRHGPAAILQPLPERLWQRTWARTVAGTLTAPRACAPNSDLDFVPFGGHGEKEGTAVPVLEIDPEWLGRWTALVAGGPSATAAVTWVSGRPPERAVAIPRPALSAAQRVRQFRAAASNEAYDLARYVALGDPAIEVIRYVHHAMFDRVQSAHLAEVLLSGLLHVEDSQRGLYRFVEGVPQLLIGTFSVSELLQAGRVRERVSAAVQQQSGHHGWFSALTPGAGDGVITDESRPFAITELARSHIERAESRLRRTSHPTAPPGTLPVTESSAPGPGPGVDLSRLLAPQKTAVSYVAPPALAGLMEWCADPAGAPAALVTGRAGTGKSRLAVELAARLSIEGWRTGWGRVPPGVGPALLIVDHADFELEPPPAPDPHVRTLFLARDTGGWTRDLDVRLAIGGFGSPADRTDLYHQAVTDLGIRIFPAGDPAMFRARRAVPGRLSDDDVTPLEVALAALHGLVGASATPAVEALVARERVHAEQTAVHAQVTFADPGQLDAYLAAAQLFGADSASEARTVAQLAGTVREYEGSRRIAAWLHQLYPGEADRYWSLLAAPVRERIVLPAVRRDPGLLNLLPSVSERQAGRALQLLVPACRVTPALTVPLWTATSREPALCARLLEVARSTGGLTAELLELARATVADASTSVAVLRAIVDEVPDVSTIFAGQSIDRARDLAEGYVRLAASSAPHRTALADAVRERGRIWEREGRDEMALRTADYEVGQRRGLLSAAPSSDEAVAALARALVTWAVRLDQAGQPLHAYSAIAEAVEYYQRLRSGPGATGPDEAYALAQQARILSRLGRIQEAADAAREAVARYRDLAETEPARHSAALADALLVEAAQARLRDQRDLAVAACAEAVERYEALAAADPPGHRARLAYARSAYGMDLGDLRSHEAGLAQLERAVVLYRELARSDLRQLPGLAAAQVGRGLLLAELERPDAAAEALGEAVKAYRQLPGQGNALAGALAVQAQVIALGGDLERAVALLTEACLLRDQLHAAEPLDVGLRAELINSYQSLSRLHDQRGDHNAAHRAALRARLLLDDEE